MNRQCNELSLWLEAEIKRFVNESPENNLGGGLNEKAWDEPLVGFSNGADPLYARVREDIGEFYWTPAEIFAKTFPEAARDAAELSVICWVLPQTGATKLEQRKDGRYPSRRAVLARTNGDKFNLAVGKFVVELLRQAGYDALAPVQSPLWAGKKSERFGFASTWSERHAVFISGLGTFSLTDALITPAGTAVRIGSVIAGVHVEPTPRVYATHNEYCLYYRNQTCRRCAARCPAGAIDEHGHDKNKCREYQRNVAAIHSKEQYDIDSNYCGICLFGTPCESGVPWDKLK